MATGSSTHPKEVSSGTSKPGARLTSRDEEASTKLTSGSMMPISAEGVPPLVVPGREVTEQHDSRRRRSVYRLVTPVQEEREVGISI